MGYRCVWCLASANVFMTILMSLGDATTFSCASSAGAACREHCCALSSHTSRSSLVGRWPTCLRKYWLTSCAPLQNQCFEAMVASGVGSSWTGAILHRDLGTSRLPTQRHELCVANWMHPSGWLWRSTTSGQTLASGVQKICISLADTLSIVDERSFEEPSKTQPCPR